MSQKPFVMAIETSAPQGGVALRAAGKLVSEILINDQKRHTIKIHPAMAELLSQQNAKLSDLDVFGFSVGPGSFTGLRLGATIARLMSAVSKAQIVAVPSLEVLAYNTLSSVEVGTPIAVVLDARRGGIFAAEFVSQGDQVETRRSAELTEPESFANSLEPGGVVLGRGLVAHGEHFAGKAKPMPENDWLPQPAYCALLAERMAAAGRLAAAHEIIPNYLRPPACEEVYEAKRTAARERRGE